MNQKEIKKNQDLLHGSLSGVHELGGKAKFAVGAEDGKRGDVAVALIAFFFHLGMNVTDDSTVAVLSHVEQLRQGEDVKKVVLHLVILRHAGTKLQALHDQHTMGSEQDFSRRAFLGRMIQGMSNGEI
ncbi:hypothetical protein SLE2022_024670 [Rubroshorea leprosula]